VLVAACENTGPSPYQRQKLAECRHLMDLAQTAGDSLLVGRMKPEGTAATCNYWIETK